VIDVVREADRDPAPGRRRERTLDDPREVVGEVEVVDRDLERPLRGCEEVRQRRRRPLGRLRAVGQRVELDQEALALQAALWIRFASW
jgi:hypothetical protein